MKLCHLTSGEPRVFADIRAALMSLGRGNSMVDGVAFLGVRSPENSATIDAVVLLPHKILLLLGVDLPGPVLKLDAPCDNVWHADNWPIVDFNGQEPGFVNPAQKALHNAETTVVQLNSAVPQAPEVTTVIAVGPYAETIIQPESDLARHIRVIHPNPVSLLETIESGARSAYVLSTTDVRALMDVLKIKAEFTEEQLVGEGFTQREPHRRVPPAPPSPPEPIRREPAVSTVQRESHTPAAQRPKAVPARSRGLAAVALTLCALLIGAAVISFISGDPGHVVTAQEQVSPKQSNTAQSLKTNKESVISQTLLATAADRRCASHASGELQNSLRQTSCSEVCRGSILATVDDDQAAVSVADISFADRQTAVAFAALAEKPDNGVIHDVAAQNKLWPAEPPTFDGAAHGVTTHDNRVRVIRAVWLGKPSAATDPLLTRLVESNRSFALHDEK